MTKQKAQQASRKGVRYYFRIEILTLQGKITSAFCLLGLFAIILMTAAYWVLFPALERSQHVAQVLQPSNYQLLRLSHATQQLSSQAMTTPQSGTLFSQADWHSATAALQVPLDSLDQLALQWQRAESRMDLKLLKLKSNSLHQKVAQLMAATLSDEELKAQQEDLLQLEQTTSQLVQKILQSNQSEQVAAQAFIQARTQNLLWVLAGCMLMAALLGTALGTYIITSVLNEVRKLKHKILELSQGKLIAPIPTSKNELDSITKALNTLTENLRNIQRFAQEVGNGHFDTNIQVFDGQHELGQSLAGMRESLKTVALEEKRRSWVSGGLAHFAELLRSSSHSHDLSHYYQQVISELVRYLKVNQAGLYVLEEQEGMPPQLILKACYAYGRLKHEQKVLAPGQGLVGQVLLEKEPIFLNKLPQSYLQISSGLGDAAPTHLIVLPLKVNDAVNGVLELASFQALEKHELEFLQKLSENISAALQQVHAAETTARLLAEAQEMASAMQMQEEMLRQNSEELIATQEKLSRDLQETTLQRLMYEELLHTTALPQLLLAQNGTILFVNTAAARLLGQDPMQQPISHYLQQPAIMTFLQEATDRQTARLPYNLPGHEGGELQLQAFTCQKKVYISLQFIHLPIARPA